MKKATIIAVWLAAAFMAASVSPRPVFAKGPGTAAGTIMKIDTGARPVALGGSYCAVSDDLNAAQYNPAGLAQLKRQEFMLNHNEWFQEIRSEFAGYGVPVNEYWSLGMTLNFMHVKGLVERDQTGNETGGEFGAYSGLATVTAATLLNENLCLGVNVKALRENVDTESSMAYAGDAGVLYWLEDWRFGLAAQNFGSKVKLGEDGFDMPMNIRAGASYKMFDGDLLVTLDANKPLENKLELRGGAEWWIAELFAVRAGYRSNADKNTGLGVSAGFGLKFGGYQMDYSFLPYGELGNTHRLSLAYKFGEEK